MNKRSHLKPALSTTSRRILSFGLVVKSGHLTSARISQFQRVHRRYADDLLSFSSFFFIIKTLSKLFVALASNALEVYTIPPPTKLKDEQPEATRNYSVDLPGHRTDVRALCLSSDDQILASASNGKNLSFTPMMKQDSELSRLTQNLEYEDHTVYSDYRVWICYLQYFLTWRSSRSYISFTLFIFLTQFSKDCYRHEIGRNSHLRYCIVDSHRNCESTYGNSMVNACQSGRGSTCHWECRQGCEVLGIRRQKCYG